MSIPAQHPFAFDPTHGYGLEDLRALRPLPAFAGFQAFWQGRLARALAVDPQPGLSANATHHPDWTIRDIAYVSTDGFPIGGWLLTPRSGEVRRGLVVGHGYGGRGGPDFDIPVENTAILFPCFRGLSRSARAPISQDPVWHVLHDIDKPDHYILGGCVEDLWVAVSVLTALYPQTADKIGYSGISFAGGLGALALAFDRRLDRGFLEVPTFGNMALWLTLPSLGSASGAQRYRQAHPEAIDTLRFYDAATAATLIEQPMLVAVARFDPAVAPPCQFSVANARPPSDHHETFVLDAGHFDYPGMSEQHAALSGRIRRLFGDP